MISSCECTSVDWLEGKVYKPGEKGSFRIVFDSTEKEKSETVDIDVILKNRDPSTGGPVFYILKYAYTLIQ